MIYPKSRYTSLTSSDYTSKDGRIIHYLPRRFVPDGTTMPLLVEVMVVQGDRVDLIAARTLGDPEQSWRICDASNTLNPVDLTDESGRALRVAVPQF